MFWNFIARILLRNRPAWLALLALSTVFMIYQGSTVKISYEFGKLMPETDSVSIDYNMLVEEFGQASNTIVIALEDQDFFKKEHLVDWLRLVDSLKSVVGITSVQSLTEAYGLEIDSATDKLAPYVLFDSLPETGEEEISLEARVKSWPFYKGGLYFGDTYMIILRIDEASLYNANILPIVEGAKGHILSWEESTGRDLHMSGLPWLRIANTKNLEAEIFRTVGLTLLVTVIIFFLFLKSIRATVISFSIVVLGVVFSLGAMGLLGYGVSLLTSLVPPLIIVIGVPNCIYLINKYHQEYKKHGNQVLAIQRVVKKVGYIALITNTTTALGFAAFILTDSGNLVEFGVISSISIMMVFVLSMILIPVIYSYLSPPKERHMNHFDIAWLVKFLDFLDFAVGNKRTLIYSITGILSVIAVFGLFRIETAGNITSDFNKTEHIYKDVKYFERSFGGVIPLDIIIDTKREGGVEKLSTLRRIEQLQDSLSLLPELSRSISVVDFVKFAKQGVMFGNPDMYALPTRSEQQWLLTYLPRGTKDETGLASSMVTADGRKARITVQMADLSTPEMRELTNRVEKMVSNIFPNKGFDVTITGASIKFIRSTTYLVNNLIFSLTLAVLAISLIMALLFMSWRMVLISLIPNLIPMLITAGIMGFAGIPLKPSTILVFSIAFGISVDDSLHFLAKYRQELKANNWNISWAVKSSIMETGLSMFYTSIVLFCGFSVFTTSNFGGTQALGLLTSITLLIAMLSNLLLLPSFLLTMEKWITKKDLSDNILDIYDPEVDPSEDDENNML
ncbi:MAG: MMPL family transporter [Schleiferiaceae bacterium]|jgi:predicted RND superfamily exporter protein|tara:strand:+ start:8230 stop:10608 length:2379 start_codon:yes stop_codon:yes gene_type:complete